MMVQDIIALLYLFEDKVLDKESNRIVIDMAEDKRKWNDAHGLFSTIRQKNLVAIKNENNVLEWQYSFEEICLKSIFNLTHSSMPFDPDSPHWITKNAISLSRQLEIPIEKIIDIISPKI